MKLLAFFHISALTASDLADVTSLLQFVGAPSGASGPTVQSKIVVASCKDPEEGAEAASTDPWEVKYQKTKQFFCANYASLVSVTVHPQFERQYHKWYNNGWAEEAWVNFVGVSGPADKFGQLTQRLATSIKQASSKYPLVVVSFGEVAITDIDPEQFDDVVVLHATTALPTNELDLSFNFNKLLAILLAKVKTGVSLDSDMIMIGKQADHLMERTKEEINEAYPYPMLPVHFLDRDPKDQHEQGEKGWRKDQSNYLVYDCDGCPKNTMRWGQAQPSWGYQSLPFLRKWLLARLDSRVESRVNVAKISEDEDLLNVGLWSDKAWKEWCMFQPPGTNSIWDNLVPEHPMGGADGFYDDPHYYPLGLPIAFFFIHGEKDTTTIDAALQYLESHGDEVGAAKPYFFAGKYWESFADLSTEHPNLKCMM